ncbi:response regulator transcription factor [Mycolicibacterium madagascariense]|nr:response regulator transcription factor [Mycolicibacterium madagascariense]
MASVTVIDDHDAIQLAVKIWCQEANPPIPLHPGFCSTNEFLAACAERPPGVVIFDLEQRQHRPDFYGLGKVVAMGHRVIVYSHLAGDEVILQSLELGAVTFIVKMEGKSHLIDAVRAALDNEPYVGPRMAKAIYHDRSVGRPKLAPREKEVLIAWFQTESKDLVGQKLDISPTTVRTHLQRVRAKYAAVGRAAPTKSALVARAIQDGIIFLDDL